MNTLLIFFLNRSLLDIVEKNQKPFFFKLWESLPFLYLIFMARKISKELSLCHKLKYSNPFIYWTWCCRLLIFQTKIIWCNKIHSLKYLRSTTLGCRDIGIIKLEFVSKTQLLYRLHICDSDWLNFIHFLGYKYKIRLVSLLRKREDEELISIFAILKFTALITLHNACLSIIRSLFSLLKY